jgi:membrane protein required for colicin V production
MPSESFDIIIAGILVFALVMGFISGLVMQLASLLGLVCCAFFAGKIAGLGHPFITKFIDLPNYILVPLSYLLAFAIIMLAFYLAGKLLEGFIKAIQLNLLNRLTGSVFSAVKWLILTSILLNLIVIIDKNEQIVNCNIKENSLSYPYVKPIALSFIPFLDLPVDSENSIFKEIS